MNIDRQDSFGIEKEPKRWSPPWIIEQQDVSQITRSRDNIFVAVRVRPMFDEELINGDRLILRVLDNRVVVLFDPEDM